MMRAQIETAGGYVCLAETMMQALGMYVVYLPTVIIIDLSVDYSAEVLKHLLSVNASPILLLEDTDLVAQQIPKKTCALSSDFTLEDIMEAARQVASISAETRGNWR